MVMGAAGSRRELKVVNWNTWAADSGQLSSRRLRDAAVTPYPGNHFPLVLSDGGASWRSCGPLPCSNLPSQLPSQQNRASAILTPITGNTGDFTEWKHLTLQPGTIKTFDNASNLDYETTIRTAAKRNHGCATARRYVCVIALRHIQGITPFANW
jgi:hypothetical protein